MSKLSIFIDESGDFDLNSKHSPVYLYTLLFHDQSQPIVHQVETLSTSLRWSNMGIDFLHAGPIIRRESVYGELNIDARRELFLRMYHFTRKCPINYVVFTYIKSEYSDKFTLEAKMARELTSFINDHQELFNQFDEVIIYYDNGQIEMTRLLNTVFAVSIGHFKLRKVSPKEYRLFQAADLVCTMELIAYKCSTHTLSSSEKQFLYRPKEPQKPYLATIRKKHL